MLSPYKFRLATVPRVMESQVLRCEVGRRIRRLRVRRKLSQERLAETCDFHRTFVGRVERGETNASLDTLLRFARGLEVDIHALLPKTRTRRGSRS